MKTYLVLLGMALTCQTASAQLVTETFGSATDAFSIDFVTIGNPGNVADDTTRTETPGAVAYTYQIGKYEVSRDMILKANSAGGLEITLWDMSDYGGNGVNRPATGMSWYGAAKFVNWLNTSKGYQAAYNFDGTGNFQLWGAGEYNGSNPFRHKNAVYVLPTVDEWYKAAYGKADGSWSNFPNGTDDAPTAVASGTLLNTAVYDQSFSTGPADITDAGGLSAFGTMAQGGNVWEWNETAIDMNNDSVFDVSEVRWIGGGSWDNPSSTLDASYPPGEYPSTELLTLGFRVASVPEPSIGLLVALGLGGLLLQRRKTGSL